MVYVALAEAAVLVWFVVVVVVLCGLLRSTSRACARREDLLVNQLLHATGRTWQPPPAAEPVSVDEEHAIELAGWSATPEQWPVWN